MTTFFWSLPDRKVQLQQWRWGTVGVGDRPGSPPLLWDARPLNYHCIAMTILNFLRNKAFKFLKLQSIPPFFQTQDLHKGCMPGNNPHPPNKKRWNKIKKVKIKTKKYTSYWGIQNASYASNLRPRAFWKYFAPRFVSRRNPLSPVKSFFLIHLLLFLAYIQSQVKSSPFMIA